MNAVNHLRGWAQEVCLVLLLVGVVAAIWFADDVKDLATSAPRGEQLLSCAIATGSVRDLDRAIAQGADIETRNMSDCTPLMSACTAGEEAMVDALLARGADAAADNIYGFNPLAFAIFSGSITITSRLLDAGAQINAIHRGRAPLDIAVERKQHAIARFLRERGAQRAAEIDAVMHSDS